jgi:uncharacterized protein
MSFAWKNRVALLIVCAVVLGGGTARAQVKKDDKPDDEKTQMNRELKEAAGLGRLAVVRELIQKGADVQWRDPKDNGKTALVKSILLEKLDVVKVLLENGADINYPDGSGRYPVYFCHPHRDKAKAIEMLKFVLSKGGDRDLNREPGMLVSLCDHEMGPPELIPILVEAGANPNLVFKQKAVTPLIAAIQAKKPEFRLGYVKTLIENKADVNFKDKKGVSPLQWAKKIGDPQVVELLEKAGAKE